MFQVFYNDEKIDTPKDLTDICNIFKLVSSKKKIKRDNLVLLFHNIFLPYTSAQLVDIGFSIHDNLNFSI